MFFNNGGSPPPPHGPKQLLIAAISKHLAAVGNSRPMAIWRPEWIQEVIVFFITGGSPTPPGHSCGHPCGSRSLLSHPGISIQSIAPTPPIQCRTVTTHIPPHPPSLLRCCIWVKKTDFCHSGSEKFTKVIFSPTKRSELNLRKYDVLLRIPGTKR